MYFPVQYEKKPRKTQAIWKTLEKPKAVRKNPGTQDWIEKPKILGENARGGNANNDQHKLVKHIALHY